MKAGNMIRTEDWFHDVRTLFFSREEIPSNITGAEFEELGKEFLRNKPKVDSQSRGAFLAMMQNYSGAKHFNGFGGPPKSAYSILNEVSKYTFKEKKIMAQPSNRTSEQIYAELVGARATVAKAQEQVKALEIEAARVSTSNVVKAAAIGLLDIFKNLTHDNQVARTFVSGCLESYDVYSPGSDRTYRISRIG